MNIKLVKMTKAYEYCDDNVKRNEKYGSWKDLAEKCNNKNISLVAEEIVKYTIISNKYCYDGYYHQYGDYGAFVFEDDDGVQYLWTSSMRYFCGLMAFAWNILDKNTTYDYIDFYMGISPKEEKYHIPNSETEFMEKADKWIRSSWECPICKKEVPWDEFVDNCELCEECLTKSYSEYLSNKEEKGK